MVVVVVVVRVVMAVMVMVVVVVWRHMKGRGFDAQIIGDLQKLALASNCFACLELYIYSLAPNMVYISANGESTL